MPKGFSNQAVYVVVSLDRPAAEVFQAAKIRRSGKGYSPPVVVALAAMFGYELQPRFGVPLRCWQWLGVESKPRVPASVLWR